METKHEISKNSEFGACNIPKKNKREKELCFISCSIPCWLHYKDPSPADSDLEIPILPSSPYDRNTEKIKQGTAKVLLSSLEIKKKTN